MMRNVCLISIAIILSIACGGLVFGQSAEPPDDIGPGGDSDGFDGSVPFTDDSDEPFSDTYPSEYCNACRDPNDFPMDFVAHYYNGSQFHGEGPYRDSQYYLLKVFYGDGTEFVLVWTVMFDNEGSILFPTQLATFYVRLPNGQVVQQQTLVNQPNLPIGDQDVPPIDGDGGANDQGDGEDGDTDVSLDDFGESYEGSEWGNDWEMYYLDSLNNGGNAGDCWFFYDGNESILRCPRPD